MDERLAEPLVDAEMDEFVPVQVIQPEWESPADYGVDGGLNLAGTGAAIHSLMGKRGHDGSRLGLSVG